MAPLLMQMVVTLAARAFAGWRDAVRIGLAAMFVFTGSSHFSSLKQDMAAMIPPPFTGALWLVYLTGACERAGAFGLLTSRFRRAAGWFLLALLVALFPANVFAALRGVTLGGASPTPLWFRTPLQLFWIVAVWWSTIAASSPVSRGRVAPQPHRVPGPKSPVTRA